MIQKSGFGRFCYFNRMPLWFNTGNQALKMLMSIGASDEK
jgi:hypothetical protein